jgi:hypothetical protein
VLHGARVAAAAVEVTLLAAAVTAAVDKVRATAVKRAARVVSSGRYHARCSSRRPRRGSPLQEPPSSVFTPIQLATRSPSKILSIVFGQYGSKDCDLRW